MADEQTQFGAKGHTIPRRERSGGEVILPQLIEGEALDLLRIIAAEAVKQTALLRDIATDPRFPSPLGGINDASAVSDTESVG